MSKITKCDRCGNESPAIIIDQRSIPMPSSADSKGRVRYPDFPLERPGKIRVLIRYKVGNRIGRKWQEFDLCVSCLNSLDHWVHRESVGARQ